MTYLDISFGVVQEEAAAVDCIHRLPLWQLVLVIVNAPSPSYLGDQCRINCEANAIKESASELETSSQSWLRFRIGRFSRPLKRP